MNTVRPPRTANGQLGLGTIGCGLVIVAGIAAAVIAPVVWFFMWAHDMVTTDEPAPYQAGRVERVTRKPTSFDDGLGTSGRERPQTGNEPFGMNRVKDAVWEDFYAKLGDAEAKVTIDCGDARLRDADFECVASGEGVKVPYRVTISEFETSPFIVVPGTGRSDLSSWKQDVVPLKAPLFREAAQLLIWDRARVNKEYEAAGAACDHMPELSLLAPGTVTEYRCYYKSKLGLRHEWSTYQVALDEDGDVFLNPVYDEER